MWTDERGVPGYDPNTHGPPRPRGKPSDVRPRPPGLASAVLAQEFAFHLAFSSMETVQHIQNGERGNYLHEKHF